MELKIKEKLLRELLDGYKDHMVLRGDEEVAFKQYVVETAEKILNPPVKFPNAATTMMLLEVYTGVGCAFPSNAPTRLNAVNWLKKVGYIIEENNNLEMTPRGEQTVRELL